MNVHWSPIRAQSFLSLFLPLLLSGPVYSSRYILFDSESDFLLRKAPNDLSNAGFPRFREAPAFRNGKECAPFQESSHSEELCDAFSVHLAMTLDAAYIRGSIAAILSIVQHAACPENVAFHFLATESEKELSKIVSSTFPYLRFKVYKFDVGLVKGKISASVREALEQPLNYARTYIADILPPCVKRVIYLDSDLIVVDDVVNLWGTSLGPHALGAPEYCHANFTQYFTDIFWSDATLSRVFQDKKACYFNTGVMVMDLEMWRKWGYSKAIEGWMEVQRNTRIYELGSLPPFLLVFAGHVKEIDHRWNQHGLGGDNVEGHCRQLHPGPVSLLHWSGKGK
eukprot:c27290_g1_i1 orf=107-1126(+)